MISCLRGGSVNISRLASLACYLTALLLVHHQLLLPVHAARDVLTSSTAEPAKASPANNTLVCVSEVLDTTLPYFSLPYRIFAGALVVPITICAIFGNILVIYVIKYFPNLRVTGNVFLASLALADVGVSTLAMTFYGLQLVRGRWILGAFMCRLWFCCDVLFSTASIMHLACIALDRYLSIVRPFDHQRSASERRRYCMIAACWIGSGLLSFIPIFTGIYTTREQRDKIRCLNRVHGRCIFAVNQAYAIVSSSFSFWVPGAVMIILYLMLIRIADRKEKEAYETIGAVERRRTSQPPQYNSNRRSSDEGNLNEMSSSTHQSLQIQPLASASATPLNGYHNNHRRTRKHDSVDTQLELQTSPDIAVQFSDRPQNQMRHLRRERRAVKTLGAIMVAFLICWLPFFVRYSACEPDRCNWKYMPIIADIVFWVGYFNSMINPFLYAFHNKDFRTAFEKTIRQYFVCCCRRRSSASSALTAPATPSGETLRLCSNKQRAKQNKSKNRSKPNVAKHQMVDPSKLLDGTNGVESANGNLSADENSMPPKRNACL